MVKINYTTSQAAVSVLPDHENEYSGFQRNTEINLGPCVFNTIFSDTHYKEVLHQLGFIWKFFSDTEMSCV